MRSELTSITALYNHPGILCPNNSHEDNVSVWFCFSILLLIMVEQASEIGNGAILIPISSTEGFFELNSN